MKEVLLTDAMAVSAVAIQEAIDSLGQAGGRVVLPEAEVVLDRGLQMRSNVELAGQGKHTILRHKPGRLYPVAGYHNYGMLDLPLEFSEGLGPGMTVTIRDNVHGGFFETFARITWVDGKWVGLDCGLHSDYVAEEEPVLITSFPLIYGQDVENVAVRDLCLDGNRAEQPQGIGACRGAAVYWIRSHHITVSNMHEARFAGEGLGFQMCSQVHISQCRCAENTGNGFHPGAGSTAALFDGCVAEGNDMAGFFFCVRANHITVRDSSFVANTACGVSVGTRDCYNRVEGCRMADNGGPGILFRATPRPVEVHSCSVSRCLIEGNARKTGRGQIEILGDAHDLLIRESRIVGLPAEERTGVYMAPSVERIWLTDNQIEGCFPSIVADPACLATGQPAFQCGSEAVQAVDLRHLAPPAQDYRG